MKKTYKNMKFAEGEVVYAYYRHELTLATILGSRIVSNMYGPCSHLYTVRLTTSKKETLEVEDLDELRIFRHATFISLQEKQREINDMIEEIKSIQPSYNERRDTLQKSLNDGDITIEQYDELIQRTNDNEKKEFNTKVLQMNKDLDSIMERVIKHCKVQHIQIPEEIKCAKMEYEDIKENVRRVLFPVEGVKQEHDIPQKKFMLQVKMSEMISNMTHPSVNDRPSPIQAIPQTENAIISFLPQQ